MDARDEVKSRLSIEDVIGQYLDLKKAGRNFKALSPFTKERTPSFIVSPEKQIWHDFSSGRGGDIFSFVMEVEGLDFREALELLARRAGLDLEQFEKPGRSSISKARLYELNELAAKFYQTQFKASKKAQEYIFKERKLTKDTVLKWQIGYSPNTGDALDKFLKAKGYSFKEISTAGLVIKRYASVVDMFRGRLMIPLGDSQGRVVGFTARALDETDRGPKYINTPRTVLYDKSRHVFGLHLAKEAIRTNSYAVVVEGNFDVIASHQAAVSQVVATAGTALTEYHLKALGLLTKDIRLCFDADKAGVAATERAIPLASKQGLNMSVISIEGGKDPDELIRKNKAAWTKTIEQPIYALDWLIALYKSQLDLSSAPGKRRFSDLILPSIRSLNDEVEIDHYLNQMSKLLEVSVSALSQKLNKPDATKAEIKRPIKVASENLDKAAIEKIKLENNFLSLALSQKKLRSQLQLLSNEMFTQNEAKELFNVLSSHPTADIKKDQSAFNNILDYVKIEVLLYEELYRGLDVNELKFETIRLRARMVENYIKNQKTLITNELRSADQRLARKLLIRAKSLDHLLNQVKEEGGVYAEETSA